MTREVASGSLTPGLRRIIDHPLGPTLRQLDYWVSNGWIKREHRGTKRNYGSSFPEDQVCKAIAMARLVRAGWVAKEASVILNAAVIGRDGSVEVALTGPGVVVRLLPYDSVVT